MSTKLYNGYKLNNLSITELKEFMDELKVRLHKMFLMQYKELFSCMAINLVDDMVAYDYLFSKSGDTTDIEKFLVERFQSSYNPCWIVDEFLKKESNLNLDSALNRCFKYEYIGSVQEIVKDMIKQKHFICNTKQMRAGMFDFQNEIALFPTDDKVLFLAYGNTFESLLQTILKSRKKEDRTFRQKFGFEYYGYWNNCDMPNGMSQKRWDARGNEWDTVLAPDYIPSKHGICSEIISEQQFLDEIDYKFEAGNDYESPISRASKLALSMIRKNWTKLQSVTMTNAVDVIEQFNELKESGDFDDEIKSLSLDLMTLLPILDEKALGKRLIDYAPNYKKAKGIE